MSDENVRAATGAVEAWNNRERDLHRSYFADDAVLHEHGTRREVEGGDAIVEVHWAWQEAIPDGRASLGSVVDGGDRVVIEVVWSGTHTGPLMTPDGGTIPPSGQPISVPAAMVLTMRGGTIASMAHYFDLATLLTQVGALPVPQAA